MFSIPGGQFGDDPVLGGGYPSLKDWFPGLMGYPIPKPGKFLA